MSGKTLRIVRLFNIFDKNQTSGSPKFNEF
jgi:hypothetical protein